MGRDRTGRILHLLYSRLGPGKRDAKSAGWLTRTRQHQARPPRVDCLADVPVIDLHVPVISKLSTPQRRSEEHTSELQSLMRTSYAVFCLNKKHKTPTLSHTPHTH